FDNVADYEALYGDTQDERDPIDLPRVKSKRMMPQAMRAKLAEITAEVTGQADAATAAAA
ncbi:MAG: hypothetical protein DI629_18335, partial [Mesorhizobium amorphae]